MGGQNVFEQPFAADRRGSASGVRRYCKHARLSQEAKAIFISEFDGAEMAAVNARNSVMTRQLLVQESLIRGQQIDDTTVFFKLRVQKELSFGDESGAQIIVEPGELGAIGVQQPNVARLEPIREEILDQRSTRARVGEHPRDLLLEDSRLVEFPADCEIEQSIVGDAAP